MSISVLSDHEFENAIVAYDLEIGPNYFIVGLQNVKTGFQYKCGIHIIELDGVTSFQVYSWNKYQINDRISPEININAAGTGGYHFIKYDFIPKIKSIKWLVSFNGNHYDDYLLDLLINDIENSTFLEFKLICKKLYNLSQDIIVKKKKFNLPKIMSLDLKRISRTDKSLKMLGGTLNYPIIQDFPVDPDAEIQYDEFKAVFFYLSYDLEITTKLYNLLRPEIKLRQMISLKYKKNVMYEDRPGIADQLFLDMYQKNSGLSIFELYKLKNRLDSSKRVKIGSVVSDKVQFKTPKMIEFLKEISEFYVNCDVDKITIGIEELKINETIYQMGAGGLHSKDDPGIFTTDSHYVYRDADVSSYYPRLIVTNKLYPKYLNPLFYTLLEKLMIERLEAKALGDMVTADTLKIVINSIFGKTGEKNNWYYSPEVFLGTTINGQLYLLMLIESLELAGIQVVSANTDGITAKIPRSKEALYKQICEDWMKATEMELEFANYDLYARLSVGSYMAVTDKGKVKTKGEFNDYNDITLAATPIVIPRLIIKYLIKTYLEKTPVSVKDLMTEYIRDPKNSIYDFMWTQKPGTSDWTNVMFTSVNYIPISKTVRHLVCKKSYPHRVKLMKEHVSQKGKGGIPKRIAYVSGEYSAITSNMFEVARFLKKYDAVRLDYYIADIESKIRLMTTKKISGNLTLF